MAVSRGYLQLYLHDIHKLLPRNGYREEKSEPLTGVILGKEEAAYFSFAGFAKS
jgi:hypothetical protein